MQNESCLVSSSFFSLLLFLFPSFLMQNIFSFIVHVTSFVVNTRISLNINEYIRTIKIKIILPKYNFSKSTEIIFYNFEKKMKKNTKIIS